MTRPLWSNRGINREWAMARKLRAQGKIVIRSSGSHGAYDLVVIDREARTIQFLQLKGKTFSVSKEKKLRDENDWLNASFNCEFRLVRN